MNYSALALARLVSTRTAGKLSAERLILGALAFGLIFCQLPGAALLLIGSGIALAAGRAQLPKLLWLLPTAGCVAAIVRIRLSP